MIILLLLSSLVHWPWVSNISILSYGDWGFIYAETMKGFYAFPHLWVSDSLGGVNIGISFYPFQFCYGILSRLSAQYGLIERLVFMWPIVIVGPISIYILLQSVVKNKYASIIGSISFLFNTYFFGLKTGHLTLMTAFSFAPLALYLFRRYLDKRDIPNLFFVTITFFVVSFYEFRAFYILSWVLGIQFLFFLIFPTQKKSIKEIMRDCIMAGIPFLLTIILNAYWILGLSQTGTIATNEFFSRTLFGNEFMNIAYAFTSMHPFWTGKRPAEFISQQIPFYFWTIPIFAFLGFYFNRKKKDVIFFATVGLLGILLTKQVGIPFVNVYEWLYIHMPGFNAFREASKFYFLIALSYSVLIAFFVSWLWSKPDKTVHLLIKIVCTCIISFVFLWIARPAIKGDFKTMFVARTIHPDFIKIKNKLLSNNDFSRTYWIPRFSRWSFYSKVNPEVSSIIMIDSNWKKYISETKLSGSFTEAELMIELFKRPEVNNLFDQSSIRYVFVPIVDKENDDDFFRFYKKPREYYISELDKVSFLKKVDMGLSSTVVYENKNFRPHIYLTDSKESLVDTVSIRKVPFRSINPTQYQIKIEDVSSPFYMYFTDEFHPDWRVRVGDMSMIKALTDSHYFLSTDIHTPSDAGLNQFRLDPAEICRHYQCTKKNGKYSMELTLFFKPQAYVYLGFYLGGITTVSMIIVLLYSIQYKYMSRRKKDSRNEK